MSKIFLISTSRLSRRKRLVSPSMTRNRIRCWMKLRRLKTRTRPNPTRQIAILRLCSRHQTSWKAPTAVKIRRSRAARLPSRTTYSRPNLKTTLTTRCRRATVEAEFVWPWIGRVRFLQTALIIMIKSWNEIKQWSCRLSVGSQAPS